MDINQLSDQIISIQNDKNVALLSWSGEVPPSISLNQQIKKIYNYIKIEMTIFYINYIMSL